MDEPDPKYPWQRATGLPIGMIRQHIWLGYYESKEDIANSPVPAGTVKPGYLKYKDLNDDGVIDTDDRDYMGKPNLPNTNRSEEHTSELQSLMRLSYAVFCLTKKIIQYTDTSC